MFEAKYILLHLILPPGIFIVLLAGFAVHALLHGRRRSAVLALLLGATLGALSLAPVADRLIEGLERRHALPTDPGGDVIVLLGGGVYGKAPDLTGQGFPADGMLPRLIMAARLQRRLGVPVVVSGGKVFAHKESEAPIVVRILTDLGVPPGKIIAEGASRNTSENARYTKRILDANGFRAPLLVTSAYHMPRSVAYFLKAGVIVTPVPAGYRSWKGKTYRWDGYLPSAGGLFQSAIALREYIALAYGRIA